MIVSVVVLMCHTLASIPEPVCREEVVIKDDMSMNACLISQAAIAGWKENSMIYHGDQWTVARIRCIPGDYSPKDAI